MDRDEAMVMVLFRPVSSDVWGDLPGFMLRVAAEVRTTEEEVWFQLRDEMDLWATMPEVMWEEHRWKLATLATEFGLSCVIEGP